MEVFIEPIEPAPELYIFGAGHVGFSLALMAHETGFRVHIIDDRVKFANSERFPKGVEVVVDDIPFWLEQHKLPTTAYAVIVTRGHRHDLDVLRILTPCQLRYLGLIGSRAKVRRIFDVLVSEGLNLDFLSRVHAPIGLNIGAITPQEIAVSILAELVAVKHGKVSATEDVVGSLNWSSKA